MQRKGRKDEEKEKTRPRSILVGITPPVFPIFLIPLSLELEFSRSFKQDDEY